jgi:hypothetical protein
MREVVGSTHGLDFYLLCEPIYVSRSSLLYRIENIFYFSFDFCGD